MSTYPKLLAIAVVENVQRTFIIILVIVHQALQWHLWFLTQHTNY